MVGERDREQDAVRWEQDDTAAISIPPPFNNGILQYNQLQHQHYAAMAAAAAAEDMPGRWDDDQNYGLMGGDMGGGAGTTEKGVRFPATSPTHGFSNGQLSQAPLQSAHSRYNGKSKSIRSIKCKSRKAQVSLDVEFTFCLLTSQLSNHFCGLGQMMCVDREIDRVGQSVSSFAKLFNFYRFSFCTRSLTHSFIDLFQFNSLSLSLSSSSSNKTK